MFKQILLIPIILLMALPTYGQGIPKNELALSGFYNYAKYSTRPEKWNSFGASISYSRHIWDKVYVGISYGRGHLDGKDSWIFEMADPDKIDKVNLGQFRAYVGYDIYQSPSMILSVYGMYLRSSFQAVSSSISRGMIIDGEEYKVTSINYGVIQRDQFGLGLSLLNRISENGLYLKTDLGYCPSLFYGQEMVNLNLGLAFRF
ncbi:hypothetical protein [Echinicola rosea]|uniref:Outer membrane protein beta-barrel domain-containing protein n=1 Tax=Echinicola rosea TaxID=1807691 RepID=A0ABQ1UZP2_9BACT|nr:hypothetical protein [Echinicola rosea]GGF32165.1 hypothetical protein GCM10011339_20440 [Echinicola rosea]